MSGFGITSRQEARRLATAVRVAERIDAAGRGGARWDQLPGCFLLKITGNATGGGWYTAKLWLPPTAKPAVTSGITEAALGTLGDYEVYYGNLAEIAKTTHDLTHADNANQKIFVAFARGLASDDKPYYVGTGVWLKDCGT